MNNIRDDIDNIASEFLDRESRDRTALAILLNRYTTAKDKLFVQRAEMGGTESFIGAVTLEWFAERVRFASQLPLFREKFDEETGKVVVDKETIDDILQRPLDWSRQSALAQYLAARPRHKFPPVLVVVSQQWADDMSADEWGSDGRAIRSTVNFSPLDQEGEYGMLDVSPEMQIFALDGQHRLLGVMGLMELIKSGSLPVKDKSGAQRKGRVVRIQDLEERFGVSGSEIQALGQEEIGIEFITAVLPGEKREDAKRRVRSIFVHVNRMAAKLSAGQIHQLEEDDGFALVAKRIAVEHPFMEPKGRVNMESNTISTRSQNFTTLQTLTDMSKGYLGPKYPGWDLSESGLIPMRPEDEELSDGERLMAELVDEVVELPSIKRVAQGTPTTKLRNFTFEVVDKDTGKTGEGNLLFRPVGQQVLAAAVGALVQGRKDGPSLQSVFNKLKAFDKEGGFAAIDKPSSVWYGVLYDPNGKRMRVSGRKLAIQLLMYLLDNGLDDDAREELREQFADARTIEDRAMDYSGKQVDPADIDLPNPL